MGTVIHSVIWSVDTEILRQGNQSNAVGKLSLFDRLGLLGNVAKEANTLATQKWRSEPLPQRAQLMYFLFTAPEYLFAYSDRRHLISEEEKRGLVRSLAVMSRDFPMMIMIPGSIAWKKPMLRSNKTSRLEKFHQRIEASSKVQMHQAPDWVSRSINNAPNSKIKALYFETRERMLSDQLKTVQETSKQTIARADSNALETPERCFFARNTAYAFQDGKEVGRYHKQADYFEVFPEESDGGFVVFMPGGGGRQQDRFQVGPLGFGMEICADHEVGYLSARGGLSPDLHVVLSAKVRLDFTHTVTTKGGYIVHACSDSHLCGVYGNGLGESFAVHEIPGETTPSAFLGQLHYHRLVI